jgi:hypothetical protein
MRVILVPLGGEAYEHAPAAAHQLAGRFRTLITGPFAPPDLAVAIANFQGTAPGIVGRPLLDRAAIPRPIAD